MKNDVYVKSVFDKIICMCHIFQLLTSFSINKAEIIDYINKMITVIIKIIKL
jgi:hypothetical protein